MVKSVGRKQGHTETVSRPSNGSASLHPPRFELDRSAGTLMDSEHRGRYHWAAQVVAGRSVLDAGCGSGYGVRILSEAGAGEVTGIDIDSEAIAAAERTYGGNRASFLCGDLAALGLPDDSFDVAVCFEAIEHLPDPARGIAELRRVIRPGGTIVVSSPNPGVYPAGNEHHLRELAPAELLGLVEEHFEHARLHLQQAWLGSLIEPSEPEGSLAPGAEIRMRRTSRCSPADATFALVVGSDRQVQPAEPLLSLGDPFEVGWWEEQVASASRRAEQAMAEANGAASAELKARLERQERESARALEQALERERQATLRLRETGAALLDANQELAETPLLKHRLAELHRENAELEALRDSLLGSRSWRWTAWLRNFGAFLKLSR